MWAPSKALDSASEVDLAVDSGPDLVLDVDLDEESDAVVDTVGLPDCWREGWGV